MKVLIFAKDENMTVLLTKNVDTSLTTPNFILTCSSRELLQLSGSRLPIQHSHTELQVTLILEVYT